MNARFRIRRLWLLDISADVAAVACSYYLTLIFRFHSEWGGAFFDYLSANWGVGSGGEMHPVYEGFYHSSAPRIVGILAATLCFLYAMSDLYAGRRFIVRRQIAWRIIVSNAAALLLFYVYFYLSRNEFHPRSLFVIMLAINTALASVFRGLAARLLARLRRLGFDRWRTLIVGSGRGADVLSEGIRTAFPQGLELAAVLPIGAEGVTDGLLDRIRRTVRESAIDVLVVAESRLEVRDIMLLLELADEESLEAKVLTDKLDVLVSRAALKVDFVEGIPFVHFGTRRTGLPATLCWRLVSMLSASVLLVLFAPVMFAAALLIRLTSPGPVLFVQERIGVNRKPFRMFKFRTMRHVADQEQLEKETLSQSAEPIFKLRSDPRVTPVGRLLRMFSIDELPQLINVIRGEMRIVGPRPLPRRDYANYYEKWHYTRHDDLPGMTCLWQVSGRSNLDFHSMCILDIYYLRNRSWVLDLRLILRTAWTVLFARGAY
jgi:exopolysaccharide biosynthesis polyprenyl glycosylphosphotransferase